MASNFTPGAPAAATNAAAAAEPARRSWLKRLAATLGGAALAAPAAAAPASPEHVLGDDVYVGEIMMFAGNFPPRGFALCNGQLLSIASNTALFSLLGTQYGGDGRTNFALPNLQGCTPIGQGNGPGLTPRVMGEQLGSENITLLSSNLPSHTHAAQVSAATATDSSPAGKVPAPATATNASGEAVPVLTQATAAPNAAAAPTTVAITGSNAPLNLASPYLTISYCIALQGAFPPRQ